MKAKIAVFAKTPELSPVKTRLAAETGEAAATAVYERSLLATAAVLRALPEWISPVWAVGEADAPSHPRWREFPTLFTGEGGLGKRLANIYSALREDDSPAILIGSDSPQLSPQAIVSAAERATGRIVLGPSADGGFYLFASSLPIPEDTWTAVEYSAAGTLADLEGRLPRAERIRLPELCDLDDLSSLQRARRELREAPLPEQRAMAEWLAEKFPARARASL